jgi:hypothetical protein
MAHSGLTNALTQLVKESKAIGEIAVYTGVVCLTLYDNAANLGKRNFYYDEDSVVTVYQYIKKFIGEVPPVE